MMPNHKKKGDYYVNPCNTKFNSKKGNKGSFYFDTKALISLIPTRRMSLWRPIMKKKVIIMWIHVYPNWNASFNSKKGNKRSFSYETKASISFIPTWRTCLWCPIMKRKEIIMWIDVYPNWKTYFNSKIGNKRSFSFETNASISLILIRRTCLWFPIIERKEIVMWIHVYPNWKTYFNSKIGNKRSFYYETIASISLIPMRRMCLWCPIMKRKEIIMRIHVYPNWNTNFNSKIGNKRSFYYETKASISLIPKGECVYDAQSWKERRLLCESMFIPIEIRTSILKLVIREVFIMKPKHQYH